MTDWQLKSANVSWWQQHSHNSINTEWLTLGPLRPENWISDVLLDYITNCHVCVISSINCRSFTESQSQSINQHRQLHIVLCSWLTKPSSVTLPAGCGHVSHNIRATDDYINSATMLTVPLSRSRCGGSLCSSDEWQRHVVVSIVGLINQVHQCWAWLVLGCLVHLHTDKPSRYVISQLDQLSLPSLRVGKWGPALAGKAKAWFTPFADKRVGVQVKLRKPLQGRPLLQRFWGGLPTERRYNSVVAPHRSDDNKDPTALQWPLTASQLSQEATKVLTERLLNTESTWTAAAQLSPAIQLPWHQQAVLTIASWLTTLHKTTGVRSQGFAESVSGLSKTTRQTSQETWQLTLTGRPRQCIMRSVCRHYPHPHQREVANWVSRSQGHWYS